VTMAKSKKKVAKTPVKKKAAVPKKVSSKKISKPTAKKAKPAAGKVKPSAKKSAKPVAKKVKTPPKPVAKAKTAPKKQVKPAPKKIVKPVATIHPRVAGKPVVKPIVKPTIQLTKKKDSDLRTRYSDQELEEFRLLIIDKVDAAKKELKYLQDQINRTGDNGTDDTENKFASSDDGSSSMEREYLNQMAARQILYIDHLDKALVRIQNKTYGICRVTGKLIEKDRLRAVPHATLSMEAKLSQSHS